MAIQNIYAYLLVLCTMFAKLFDWHEAASHNDTWGLYTKVYGDVTLPSQHDPVQVLAGPPRASDGPWVPEPPTSPPPRNVRPRREAKEQALKKMKNVQEWESCSENSAMFKRVAQQMDQEFSALSKEEVEDEEDEESDAEMESEAEESDEYEGSFVTDDSEAEEDGNWSDALKEDEDEDEDENDAEDENEEAEADEGALDQAPDQAPLHDDMDVAVPSPSTFFAKEAIEPSEDWVVLD